MGRAKNDLAYVAAARLAVESSRPVHRWNSAFFNKITDVLRPRIWLAIFGIPLGVATTYAGVLWYHVLVARGFGDVMNSIAYASPFNFARVMVLCLAVPSLLTYPFVRHTLSKSARLYFVFVLGFAFGLMLVPEFLENYGPTPWWHF
jgi:hypothetical protein